MLKSLNVHLGGPLGPVSTDLATFGFQAIRFDVASVLPARLHELLVESTANGLRLLPIVETLAHVERLPAPDSPTWLGVEILNEPNVGNHYTPASYATVAGPLISAAIDRGLLPWVGCIYNMHAESQAWLAYVLARLPHAVGVTVHRYPWGEAWETPAKGFRTRADEMRALKAIVGTRRFGLSEFGFTEERRCQTSWSWRFPFYKKTCNQWSSTDVLVLLRREFAFWESHGAEFAVVYQLNNGPVGSDEQYGIRTHPDGVWKPQAECCRP